jgi:uncharacterized lipoprotein YddW (UPF0748 family)
LKSLFVVLCCIALALLSAVPGMARSEFRGAWVTAWDHGFLSPSEANATVAAAKAAHINALFIQVRKVGDAYYNSQFEPRASNISADGYDPLGYIIDRAHSEGIEVHAWINVLRVQSPSGSNADPSHVRNSHPEWLTRDASGRTKAPDGFFLDPGVPEVQDYTVRIVADILSNYNVDGIHLDYVRYPGSNYGYNEKAVSRFNTRFDRSGTPAADDPQWLSWRRDQVTALVRKIYSEANAVRPEVKVSAATICWGDLGGSFEHTDAYREALQDWAGWMRDGIVDAVVPMNYRNERSAASASQYRNWLNGMVRWQNGRHIYAGQIIRDDLPGAVAQLRASRAAGTDGMVCFAFNDTPTRAACVSAVSRTVFSEPAEAPSMPWKERFASAPRPPRRWIP